MIARRWAPVVAWAAVILLATSIPGPALPPAPQGGDKLGHFAVYAILGLLAIRAAMAHGESWGRTMLLTLAGIAAFAALDEWHQGFIPGRFPDLADFVADVAGATVGAGSALLFTLRRSARS